MLPTTLPNAGRAAISNGKIPPRCDSIIRLDWMPVFESMSFLNVLPCCCNRFRNFASTGALLSFLTWLQNWRINALFDTPMAISWSFLLSFLSLWKAWVNFLELLQDDLRDFPRDAFRCVFFRAMTFTWPLSQFAWNHSNRFSVQCDENRRPHDCHRRGIYLLHGDPQRCEYEFLQYFW